MNIHVILVTTALLTVTHCVAHDRCLFCVVAIETASSALNLVNGYDFKGKPIIIDYGKKTQKASETAASGTDNQPNITSSCLTESE